MRSLCNIDDLIFHDFSETTLTLDPCDPNPCHHGVLCLTTWNGNETKFECGLCPDGMIGDGLNCTYTNPCSSSPCSFPLICQPSIYKVTRKYIGTSAHTIAWAHSKSLVLRFIVHSLALTVLVMY